MELKLTNGNIVRVFFLSSDGSGSELKSGHFGKRINDFAAMFIALREDGWEVMA